MQNFINRKTMLVHFTMAFILVFTLSLTACGGGVQVQSDVAAIETDPSTTIPQDEATPDTENTTPDPQNTAPASQVIKLPASSTLKSICSKPRSNPPEIYGTLEDEKAYLRSFTDETYLWYKEVPAVDPARHTDPQKYFDVLKTSRKTASGRPVDEFHWSVSEDSFNQQTAGIERGYGITWARAKNSPPRDWVVAIVEPEGPGRVLQRGDKLKSVDGEDFANGNAAKLNAGLFPEDATPHTFEFIRNNQVIEYTLTPQTISTTPVRYTRVVDTPTGKVAYIYFDEHIAKAESLLIDAINTVKTQGATDLVLDMRYNGGGLLSIASQLAYMIGGNNTGNRTFYKLVNNDKRSAEDYPYPFETTSTSGNSLPTLNLKKVTILAGYRTASASEAVINGLRGVDVDVALIGETTRGKPYGFYPQANCGWVYYSVQFKEANAKGYGDYADGFAPTCTVKDDFSQALGDKLEARFAAALYYRQTRTCPPATGLAAGLRSVGEVNYTVSPNPAKFLMIP
ncbi:MAG: S41 family peptidase, partial [Rhodoferax sp.]|nr:S41 family peptidase [Rhodoferax sp.]